MGLTTAAERKAAERINRQVAPWRYRAELEHAIGVAIGRALPTATPSAAPNWSSGRCSWSSPAMMLPGSC